MEIHSLKMNTNRKKQNNQYSKVIKSMKLVYQKRRLEKEYIRKGTIENFLNNNINENTQSMRRRWG